MHTVVDEDVLVYLSAFLFKLLDIKVWPAP